ncbi:hypothetical protein TNCT_611461 [Trichonephila clavata]|uniref:Transposase n=1 Tax=Trichonephila clavata TaxID=2740835 RepID=A0A8X6FMJ3_TRICU|nr:hypothetical protein TNCT_611461 [Trichonephila clavata]
MFAVFLDMQGPLLLELKETDVSTDAQRYTQTLDKLYKAIKNKRLGTLPSGVIVLNHIARPHIAKMCVEALAHKKGEVLEHPDYCLNLSPSDFCDPHPKLLHLWTAGEKPIASTISLRR